MNGKLIAIVLVCLLIGILVGFAVGFTAKIRTFLVDYDALHNEYTRLEGNYTILNNAHTTLLSNYNSLNAEHTQLEQDYTTLNSEHTQLEDNYTWLKQHSFTYYAVGDSINISSVEIEIDTWYDYTTVKGNITNISNEPVEEVWVYVILRNPDGTMYFDSWKYEIIADLYIGETASFDITCYSYVEGQNVEIWLVF